MAVDYTSLAVCLALFTNGGSSFLALVCQCKTPIPHQTKVTDQNDMNLLSVCRDEALEADLKTLLYYFRHHTVEPEILKRLCFVEIVYSLQNHANRYHFESHNKHPQLCSLLIKYVASEPAVHTFTQSAFLPSALYVYICLYTVDQLRVGWFFFVTFLAVLLRSSIGICGVLLCNPNTLLAKNLLMCMSMPYVVLDACFKQ